MLLIHAKIRVSLGDIGIYLLETPVVQQSGKAFPGREFAFSVLGFNPFGATTLFD